MSASRPPEPTFLDSWQLAESNAVEWMKHWGFTDARMTPGGPDGGVDVHSSEALAQVKFEAHQTGAPALQRLVGARGKNYELQLIFFSGAGYSRTAIEYAEEMEIALFKYDLLGRPFPVSSVAATVAAIASAHKSHDRRAVDPPGTSSSFRFPPIEAWIFVFFGCAAIGFWVIASGEAPLEDLWLASGLLVAGVLSTIWKFRRSEVRRVLKEKCNIEL